MNYVRKVGHCNIKRFSSVALVVNTNKTVVSTILVFTTKRRSKNFDDKIHFVHLLAILYIVLLCRSSLDKLFIRKIFFFNLKEKRFRNSKQIGTFVPIRCDQVYIAELFCSEIWNYFVLSCYH